MKFASMLVDALRSIVEPPATEQYPAERRPTAPGYRGRLRWRMDTCTGCGLCAMDCPADAIDVIVLDKKAKRFVFRYHPDRCTFCGQCVLSCRQNSLEWIADAWEPPAEDRESFGVCLGRDEDVRAVLGDGGDGDAEPPAGG